MGEEIAEDRSEGFGERLLGLLLDRARLLPPQLIAPLIAEEVGRVGGRDVSILLQDYAQELLVPLPGRKLHVGQPESVIDSHAGRAFLRGEVVEVPQARGGVRMYLPLLDGGDTVGVMALTLDAVGGDDRRLLSRLSCLVADLLVTKNAYTDQFFQARRREPMSVSAEIQWTLLPPLSMTVPQVEVAGILEPAYRVAGDSFDYALNDNILHAAVIDAMGHGVEAATMATVAIGAYRHARRVFISLAEKYAFMDDAVSRQFGPDRFTAQLMHINVATGAMELVNAGHPAPLLIRDGQVVRQLESATTLPVGFGGEEPRIREHTLQQGDRVLCYTDGIIEEHVAGGDLFGEERLIRCVNRLGEEPSQGLRADLRRLSHMLKSERGGHTSDDATLFMIEWRGGAADHLAVLD
ncbi:serine/threonine-protein phosphatase [Streptomyces sp. NBC_00555]|uniref:PP2C family protein-serine/threonine phosphatase n=1 Tax=Streptomyces sp. NBC_00555 TaxID=2903662 RepID=UPI00224E84A2|nr:PP2C family protein-serine/threonine phosphatase [Streptomyces sp. NBC_00555]MCX5009478.1 serine/threonine-protein phosphatase [Streptomyces sp. NBC_00555]